MDSTCPGNRMPESEEARDTDSLMMEEKMAAAANAPETHIIGGKWQTLLSPDKGGTYIIRPVRYIP